MNNTPLTVGDNTDQIYSVLEDAAVSQFKWSSDSPLTLIIPIY